MSKSMLVNVTAEEEHRVAMVDNGVLDNFEIETLSREHLKGDIFKAVVEGVNPALEAAFVNYGAARAGFLPLDEVNFKLYPSRDGGSGGKGRGRITRHLEKGMEVLAQVIRDAYANKPPTLSTYYSLPGRYLVLMPGADAGGISRKIEDAEHRDRLRKILEALTVPEGFGVIVRTAGMEVTSQELQADLEALLELWRNIEKASQQVKAPALIFQERDLVIRTIRDYFTSDVEEVLIDDEPTFRRARKFFEAHMPDKADVVRLYTGDKPIFTKHNLEDQIERIYKRVVDLKSGGSISIDQTEALTAIDVNSSRSARSGSSEDTAARTNLEAAEEIARQLRLRDIGGLVVIDFIDMESAKHIRQVERTFSESMSRDKARYDVTRISKLGLMEVSRQRIKSTKASSSFMECPTCSGDGTVRTPEAAARSAFRKIQARVARGDIAGVKVYLPPDVALYLLNEKRDDLYRLESRHQVRIEVAPEGRMKAHQFEIEESRREEPEITAIVTAETVDQALASGALVPPPPRTLEAGAVRAAESSGQASARAPGAASSSAEAASLAGGKKRRRRRRRRGGQGAGLPKGDSTVSAGRSPDAVPADATGLHDGQGGGEEMPVFSEGPDADRIELAASDDPQPASPPTSRSPASLPGGSPQAEGAQGGHRRRRRRRRRGRGRGDQAGLAGQPGGRVSEGGARPPYGESAQGSRPSTMGASSGSSSSVETARPSWSGPDSALPLQDRGAGQATPTAPAEPEDLSVGPGNEASTPSSEKPRRRWWRRSVRG
jgi:ribonuclease E